MVATIVVGMLDKAKSGCPHTDSQRDAIVTDLRKAIAKQHYDPIIDAMEPACDDDRTIYKVYTALGAWGDDPPPVCLWAAFGLSKLVGYGDWALIDALSHDDDSNRHAAAFALGKMGADAANAIEALEALAADPSELVRDASQESLRRIRAAMA